MEGKASPEVLEALHNAVAKALTDKIVNPDGTLRDKVDPRVLTAAIKFLKDNNVEQNPLNANPRKALDEAAAGLPVTDSPYDQESEP